MKWQINRCLVYRFVFIVAAILMPSTVVFTGCASNKTPTATMNITGNLTGINTPAQPGTDTVTIQTGQGPETFLVTPNTTFAVNGQFCTIEEFAALLAANETHNCTIVYDYGMVAQGVYSPSSGNTTGP